MRTLRFKKPPCVQIECNNRQAKVGRSKNRLKDFLTRHVVKFAVLSCMVVPLIPSLAMAKDLAGWVIMGQGQGIMEGQTYSLYNIDQRAYLQNHDRAGVNLSWTPQPNNYMKVKRGTPGSGPLKCGETFALWVEATYYFWGKQPLFTGINLTSKNDNPKPEWKFTNCQAGSVIPLNQKVTLTNTKTNDSVVGCKRAWGVNLCWALDVVMVKGQYWRKEDVPGSLRKYIGTAAGAAVGGPVGAAAGGILSRGVEGEGQPTNPDGEPVKEGVTLSAEEEKALQSDAQGEKLAEMAISRAVPPILELKEPSPQGEEPAPKE